MALTASASASSASASSASASSASASSASASFARNGNGSAADDTTGAVIDLQRSGDRIDVRGLYVNRDGQAGELRYSLSVDRSGSGGSMTSRQSGTFETAPPETDTLSTVTVNASGGAELSIILEIRDGDRLVDDDRWQMTVD
jgi:hypothetical protein